MADQPTQASAPAEPANPPAPQQASTPPAEAPTEPAKTVESDEKLFAAIGYLGPLFVFPLIVKPKSNYCKHHARQSMVLFLMFILVLVFLMAIPMIGSILTLALFAIYILAIYRAYKGDLWNIPVVSSFAGKMNVESLYGKAGLAVNTISGLKEKAEDIAAKAGEAAKDLGKQEEPPAESPQEPPAEQKAK